MEVLKFDLSVKTSTFAFGTSLRNMKQRNEINYSFSAGKYLVSSQLPLVDACTGIIPMEE